MASRILYGSRATKHKTKAQDSAEKPSALAKRTSLSAAPSTASRIPTQSSSFFSKAKSKAVEERQPRTSQPGATISQVSGSVQRQPLASKSELGNTAPAIHRGLRSDMGVRTETSARPTHQRNRLRRKTSSQDQRSRYARSETTESSHEIASPPQRTGTTPSLGDSMDPYPGSVLGIGLPSVSTGKVEAPVCGDVPTEHATSNSRMASYVPKNPHPITTQDLPPPTPSFARSSSSSTRCSESPGPFSRTSTPTSASSHSPGILQTSKFAPRTRQAASPTQSRPPVTRRKLGGPVEDAADSQGLPAVRESITSSSSSSTVKGSDPREKTDLTQLVRRKRAEPPPPTPPLRISSKRGPKPTTIGRNLPSKEDERVEIPKGASKPSQLPTPQSSKLPSKLPAPNAPQSRAPPRPSREGAVLFDDPNASPVIQSNLSHLATTGHKRRESIEKAIPSSPENDEKKGTRPGLARFSSITSKNGRIPLRLPQASDSAKRNSPHLHPSETSRHREPPNFGSDVENKPPKRDPSPISATPNKSMSRFGLFSRKIKSPVDQPAQPSEKPLRKGPAAGTGHEGYGKYARRGRSSSTSTAASRGRSTSTDRTSFSVSRPANSRKSSFASSDGKPELDDFFKDRLEPVVIGGGGAIRENRNSSVGLDKTISSQSSTSVDSTRTPASSRFGYDSVTASSATSSQRVSREFLPEPRFAAAGPHSPPSGTPTLAHRRSLHRSQLFGEPSTKVKVPAPINTQRLAPSPLLDTYDSTISSAPQTDTTLILTGDLPEGHESSWLKPKKKTQDKSKLNRKWNFFVRGQRAEKEPLSQDSYDSARELPVAIASYPEPRTVAHYAMLDGSEPEGEEDLEEILRSIEDNLEIEAQEAEAQDCEPERQRETSVLLPSPSKFPAAFEPPPRPISPKMTLSQQAVSLPQLQAQPHPQPRSQPQLHTDLPPPPPPRKPSRLPQVGRIPRVVSKRDRLHNPSPQSFSRPFAPRPSIDEGTPMPKSAIERPALGIRTDELSQEAGDDKYEKATSAPPTNGFLHNLDGEKEFFAFTLRQDSEVSGSTSSGVLSLAPVTAVTPQPGAVLSDDEVWNEYDDLLDTVASPASFSPSSPGTTAALNSFPSLSNIRYPGPVRANQESPLVGSDGSSDTARGESPRPKKLFLPLRSDHSEISYQDAIPSPVSLSDLYTNYANLSGVGQSAIRHSVDSTISGSRYSSQPAISRSGSQRSSTHSNRNHDHVKRPTQATAEKTTHPASSSDSLRLSALMTSRWLSFDRVLFSPIAQEIRNSRQDRVLVVDGLDNDDWSSYCALAYPDATFYSLSAPSASSRRSFSATTATATAAATAEPDAWTPPPNHRRISHPSLTSPFPFPKGFFSAAVLRFPAANTAAAYRNAVSECKRVLRPGGYLELSLLDMDPINMGDRARRAVRGVKMRLQAARPDVCLAPVGDTVMKLLGCKGFENLNRCVVGVPVAGGVTEQKHMGKREPGRRRSSADGSGANAQRHTLGALLSGQTADSGPCYPASQMVARVGRWWWSGCYETAVGTNEGERPSSSVWDDPALLGECERRETGFRLVLCYAQKPVSVRRRTVSV